MLVSAEAFDGPILRFIKPTRWLGILLDHGLTLGAHYKHRHAQAQVLLGNIKRLAKGVAAAPIRAASIACVLATALFGAELWYGARQTSHRVKRLQITINKCARLITGAPTDTPLGPLLKEAGLRDADSQLTNRLRRFALRHAATPRDDNRALDALDVNHTLYVKTDPPRTPPHVWKPTKSGWHSNEARRRGKKTRTRKARKRRRAHAMKQARAEQKHNTLTRRRTIAGRMAIALEVCAGTRSNGGKAPPGRAGLEHVTIEPERFESMEILVVEDKDDAVISANTWYDNVDVETLTFWTDGSRLESKMVGAAAVYRDHGTWKGEGYHLKDNKEVFDAEVYAITGALEIALRQVRAQVLDPAPQNLLKRIVIFTDAQTAQLRLGQPGAVDAWFAGWRCCAYCRPGEGRC